MNVKVGDSVDCNVRYLRIIANTECNLSCSYCHNEGGAGQTATKQSADDIILFTKLLCKLGVRKVKFMGGEPMLRQDLPEIISSLRSWSQTLDISLITNGVWPTSLIKKYKESGISRINVSIHQWDFDRCVADSASIMTSHEQTKRNVLCLKESGLLSKINFVLLRDKNENELSDMIGWAGEHGLMVDVLNMLYPLEIERQGWHYYYEFHEIEKIIGQRFHIREVEEFVPEIGLPSKRLHLENSAVINLKTSQLYNYKPFMACNRCPVSDWCVEGIQAIRMTVDGKIKPCLFRDDNLFDLQDIYHQKGLEQTDQELSSYLRHL